MKAAPPSCPVIYGNRHILPKPTAEPAVARITPILVPNFPLCSIIYILFSQIYHSKLYNSSLFCWLSLRPPIFNSSLFTYTAPNWCKNIANIANGQINLIRNRYTPNSAPDTVPQFVNSSRTSFFGTNHPRNTHVSIPPIGRNI